MNNKTILRISENQLPLIKFDKVDQKKYPHRNAKNIIRMLKIATNKTMHSKSLTTVVFQSKKRGVFSVKSSVLMAGKDFVVFKGGYTLPIKSIIQVKA